MDEDSICLSNDEKFKILSAKFNVKIFRQSYNNVFTAGNGYLNDSVCLILNDPPYGKFDYIYAAG